MPICCRLDATNRAQPQISPTRHSVGFFHFATDSRKLHLPISSTNAQGIRNSTASRHRAA